VTPCPWDVPATGLISIQITPAYCAAIPDNLTRSNSPSAGNVAFAPTWKPLSNGAAFNSANSRRLRALTGAGPVDQSLNHSVGWPPKTDHDHRPEGGVLHVPTMIFDAIFFDSG